MGISIENLSFHYTGTPVLDQVNLEVKKYISEASSL